jgi:hypothetical protein
MPRKFVSSLPSLFSVTTGSSVSVQLVGREPTISAAGSRSTVNYGATPARRSAPGDRHPGGRRAGDRERPYRDLHIFVTESHGQHDRHLRSVNAARRPFVMPKSTDHAFSDSPGAFDGLNAAHFSTGWPGVLHGQRSAHNEDRSRALDRAVVGAAVTEPVRVRSVKAPGRHVQRRNKSAISTPKASARNSAVRRVTLTVPSSTF